MNMLGLGLKIGGAFLGGDPNANYRAQQFESAKAQYKRAEVAMKARRALGKIQYLTGINKNLEAASRAVSQNQAKYNELLAEWKWKQYEIYKKGIAKTGAYAAKGMIGKSAKRAAVVAKGMDGVEQAQLVQLLTSSRWRLNDSNKDIWSEYEAANRETYDRSGIGRPDSIGAPPVKPKGPSTFSRIAPVLGVLGNYFVNKYQAPEKTVGDLIPSSNRNSLGFSWNTQWDPMTYGTNYGSNTGVSYFN
jgi:hypothetical protein